MSLEISGFSRRMMSPLSVSSEERRSTYCDVHALPRDQKFGTTVAPLQIADWWRLCSGRLCDLADFGEFWGASNNGSRWCRRFVRCTFQCIGKLLRPAIISCWKSNIRVQWQYIHTYEAKWKQFNKATAQGVFFKRIISAPVKEDRHGLFLQHFFASRRLMDQHRETLLQIPAEAADIIRIHLPAWYVSLGVAEKFGIATIERRRCLWRKY